jgi:hypothetical protein
LSFFWATANIEEAGECGAAGTAVLTKTPRDLAHNTQVILISFTAAFINIELMVRIFIR